MTIKYRTEGMVKLTCSRMKADPFVLMWEKGTDTIRIAQAGNIVVVSQDQLRQLGKIAQQIADCDLGPDFSQRVEAA